MQRDTDTQVMTFYAFFPESSWVCKEKYENRYT